MSSEDLKDLVPDGTIDITQKDAEMLVDLLDNPRPANAALQKAYARHNDTSNDTTKSS